MERTLFEFYLELDEELPEFMNDISTIDATFSTDILRNKHRYSNGRYSIMVDIVMVDIVMVDMAMVDMVDIVTVDIVIVDQ